VFQVVAVFFFPDEVLGITALGVVLYDRLKAIG